ncbi:sigma 54-interacting transcriptional regulator [Aquibacillus sp. 3ASR75-11]|uniref:Sigma 54-interacting transcriptional regulator n=1 Tax=Terrihalobacillus insolitus TaxID=2950438 RepID=A0A9X3WTK1_9BACI|nr:sigma 54-interacting transcriptional regulator [Terrihalobacillus insolitus]MDC3425450.1 sigma 54-interacting transcriptional regulator [Terrihalobacillus insolitus]
MKHLLPSIEKLIHKNFTMIVNNGDIFQHDCNPVIFQKKQNQYYSLSNTVFSNLTAYNVSTDDMPWNQAEIINLNEDWQTIAEKITNYDHLLVMNQSTVIGYLVSSEIAHIALQSYTYLKTYYDTILDTTDSSISVIDKDKNTVVWTSGAEKLFSIKKEEIIGKPMTDFFQNQMLENINTLETGKSVRHKQHQPREDLFVLINTNPVKIGEDIVGVVVTETDVTYQVQLNKELNNANKTIQTLREEVSRIRPSYNPFNAIKGSSAPIRKTIEKVKQIGTTQARVLLLGDSGVGKELFARAIHDIRTDEVAPFIAVNCGAIPPSLFESELFGYEKGAFSGANTQGKKGKFDLAKGGTLFLDEIGELPLEMQVKFLRVLQEGKYYAVGGTKQKQTECQIITATNKDLQTLIDEGKFREDLYYRLNIVSIKIPPLRERIEDVVELSHMFLYEFATKYNREVNEIPKMIMRALLSHHWPGNIRELRNAIERLVVFSVNGELDIHDLPFQTDPSQLNSVDIFDTQTLTERKKGVSSLKEEMETHEKDIIIIALEQAKHNKNKAAELLGVSRATLYNKMNKLNISDTT